MGALEILKKYEHNKWVYIDNKDIKKAIEELESLQNRKCENCKHYSTGKQPDGFNWHKCEYNFECKICFNDYFEANERGVENDI